MACQSAQAAAINNADQQFNWRFISLPIWSLEVQGQSLAEWSLLSPLSVLADSCLSGLAGLASVAELHGISHPFISSGLSLRPHVASVASLKEAFALGFRTST